jgi:hypothetical protein
LLILETSAKTLTSVFGSLGALRGCVDDTGLGLDNDVAVDNRRSETA